MSRISVRAFAAATAFAAAAVAPAAMAAPTCFTVYDRQGEAIRPDTEGVSQDTKGI